MADKLGRPIRPKPRSYVSAPFLWIDWALQWIAYLAGNLAVFRVLEYAGKLTVLVALIAWIAEYPQRQQAAVRTAWSIVNAKGGGRKEALEYLSSHQVDLKGMYGTSGFFAGIILKDRDLRWSELTDANFEGANLDGVNLQASKITGTNFKNASLVGANFREALLTLEPVTNFEGANINDADFRDIRFATKDPLTIKSAGPIAKSLAAARGWQNAQFNDDFLRKLIAYFAVGQGEVASPKQ